MLSVRLREMLVVMLKDKLSPRLTIISNHFNDLQFKKDQDYPHQFIIRINPFPFSSIHLSHTISLKRI